MLWFFRFSITASGRSGGLALLWRKNISFRLKFSLIDSLIWMSRTEIGIFKSLVFMTIQMSLKEDFFEIISKAFILPRMNLGFALGILMRFFHSMNSMVGSSYGMEN